MRNTHRSFRRQHKNPTALLAILAAAGLLLNGCGASPSGNTNAAPVTAPESIAGTGEAADAANSGLAANDGAGGNPVTANGDAAGGAAGSDTADSDTAGSKSSTAANGGVAGGKTSNDTTGGTAKNGGATNSGTASGSATANGNASGTAAGSTASDSKSGSATSTGKSDSAASPSKNSGVADGTASNDATGSTVTNGDVANSNTTSGGGTSGFTPEELCVRAQDYYEKTTGYRPPIADYEDGDNGTILIHLYEIKDNHTATSAWYQIDPATGKGTDVIFETEIDLSKAP